MQLRIFSGLLSLFLLTSQVVASEHRVRMLFSLRNKTAQLVEGAKLLVAGPIWAKKVKANFPYIKLSDDLGNQIYSFQFEKFPPYGSKILTFEGIVEVGKSPLGPPYKYLLPERFIESDAAEIVKRAKSLKRKDSVSTARAICTWTKGYVKSRQYVKRQRGALWALKNKQGDCTEAASLFVALCRANGIPARVLAGWLVGRSGTLGKFSFHNWAEFHDGTKWRVADPNRGAFDKPESYMATRVVGQSSIMDRYHRFKVISPIEGAIVVK